MVPVLTAIPTTIHTTIPMISHTNLDLATTTTDKADTATTTDRTIMLMTVVRVWQVCAAPAAYSKCAFVDER